MQDIKRLLGAVTSGVIQCWIISDVIRQGPPLHVHVPCMKIVNLVFLDLSKIKTSGDGDGMKPGKLLSFGNLLRVRVSVLSFAIVSVSSSCSPSAFVLNPAAGPAQFSSRCVRSPAIRSGTGHASARRTQPGLAVSFPNGGGQSSRTRRYNSSFTINTLTGRVFLPIFSITSFGFFQAVGYHHGGGEVLLSLGCPAI